MNNPNLEFLVNPDATTYFFINSGVFVTVTASVFFIMGLWMGRLLWGRDKAKLKSAWQLIEALKTEVATLKLRLAEVSSLPGRQFPPSLPPMFSAPPSFKEEPSFPESRMFYTWGEEEWEPPKIAPQPQHGSMAFTLWTSPDYALPVAALFTPSHAFSIWTERIWSPRLVHGPATPPSQAFSLWTEPGFEPVRRALFQPAASFTLWTLPCQEKGAG